MGQTLGLVVYSSRDAHTSYWSARVRVPTRAPNSSFLLLQPSAGGGQQTPARVSGSLPHAWETWLQSPAPGPGAGPVPATADMWGVSQRMGARAPTHTLSLPPPSVCVFMCMSPVFCILITPSWKQSTCLPVDERMTQSGTCYSGILLND